jgi:hypothetical protein
MKPLSLSPALASLLIKQVIRQKELDGWMEGSLSRRSKQTQNTFHLREITAMPLRKR